MPKFTGLSLSGCVWDIVRGVVAEVDVEFLLIGTCNNSPEQFAKKVEANQAGYWLSKQEEAAAIANRLYEAGKIRCPEKDELSCHNVAAGIWLTEFGTQCSGNRLYDVQREEEQMNMADNEAAHEEYMEDRIEHLFTEVRTPCEYKKEDGSCSHPAGNRSCSCCVPMTEADRAKHNIAIDPYLTGVIEKEARKEVK